MIVTTPSEWGCAAYKRWADEMEVAGRSEDCWRGNSRAVARYRRHFVAAFRNAPVVGYVRNTCGMPNCMNPRHVRVATDAREVVIEGTKQGNCVFWNGPMVSNVPMTRFPGKNVNMLHIVAERDLQDYRDLRAAMAGQTRRGFTKKPIVTRMCGNSLCINSEHFVISSEIIASRRGLAGLREDIECRSHWFWVDPGKGNRGISHASVDRWRRFLGLPDFSAVW
jgi:hypothetical protein